MRLEPLRAALRAETDLEVRRRLAEVDADCARVLAAAEAQAQALTDQGRLEGEQAAAREAVRRRATATRRARELRLQAQRRQVEELQRTSREAALRVRTDDRYPQLLDRLARAARDQLGPEAELELDPAGLGGVTGRKGKTSVDYTLPALVDRAIASLDDELERLWR
jgi:vacuolar-type H+-ATPase subunit E/Vma4